MCLERGAGGRVIDLRVFQDVGFMTSKSLFTFEDINLYYIKRLIDEIIICDQPYRQIK